MYVTSGGDFHVRFWGVKRTQGAPVPSCRLQCRHSGATNGAHDFDYAGDSPLV
jgi:hypothetical protein